MPQPDGEQKRRALHAAIAEAHRYGITSIHDATDGADEARLYEEAERSGDLKLRVYLSMPVRGGANEGDLQALDALSSRYPDDPVFKVGGGENRDRRTGRVEQRGDDRAVCQSSAVARIRRRAGHLTRRPQPRRSSP